METLDHPATVNSAHLVVVKTNRQTDLLEQFNRGLAMMKANGTNNRLVDRFIRGGRLR